MSSDYTLILRACPEGHREAAALFLGKLFSLKEHTCQQIVGSCPIILLAGLAREEAGAVHLLVHGLAASGAQIEVTAHPTGELPKIDWPRRPQIFKRELAEWVSDFHYPLSMAQGSMRLIEILVSGIEGRKAEFKGVALPEVTPFSTPALPAEPRPTTVRSPRPPDARPPTTRTPLPPPPTTRTPLPPPPSGKAASQLPAPGGEEDPMSRLNELFPDEEGGGFLPGKEDITNILNRILPDEQPSVGSSGSGRSAVVAGGGFSVFLAKIADEDRRKKASVLIAELGKIPPEEAEALSKKMIIPVLKGVSKEEAEAAKAQFGKIGILARVKEG
jgi:hypothetical protein